MNWRHQLLAITLVGCLGALVAAPALTPARGAAAARAAVGLERPFSVAVAPGGDYFVADALGGRIVHYDAQGRVLGTIGHPHVSAQLDLSGLDAPAGLALDGRGNIFVADLGDARVVEYTLTGAYVGQMGARGFDPGKLIGPVDVAVSPAGVVYVLDAGNSTVSRFSPQGVFFSRWGSYGTGVGAFDGPSGIALDARGNVYVADTNNNRVQAFSPTGSFLGQWGQVGTDNGNLRYPVAVAVDAQGTLWVADAGNRRVVQIQHPFAAQGVVTVHGARSLSGIAVHGGAVYLVDTAGERVLVLSTQGAVQRTIGSGGHGPGQLSQPMGVAVDLQGNIYVADTNNNRIEKYAPSGAVAAIWGAQGKDHVGTSPRFLGPQAVAVDPQGNVYVADTFNSRIQKLDPQGHYVWERHVGGQPRGIAVDTAGTIFVTSYYNQRVLAFDTAGNLLTQWGGRGRSDGLFRGPSAIAVDGAGKVYVGDTGNGRIEVFTPLPGNGQHYGYSGQFGSLGGGAGQFSALGGIASAADGSIYAVDQQNARVQWFDSSGTQFHSWPADPRLEGLSGLALDRGGDVIVTSSQQDHLSMYSPTGTLLRLVP